MSKRRTRRSSSLGAQVTALSIAVPQVVTHRMIRMALAGPRPTARDRREFQRMGAEKVAAFYESWYAMYVQVLRIQLDVASPIVRSLWFPWTHNAPFAAMSAIDASRRVLSVLGKGMTPVRHRAVANARRLGRVKGN